jgi:hypothetical protein
LEAMQVMAKRFDGVEGIEWSGFDPQPYQAWGRPWRTSDVGGALAECDGGSTCHPLVCR